MLQKEYRGIGGINMLTLEKETHYHSGFLIGLLYFILLFTVVMHEAGLTYTPEGSAIIILA